MTVPLVEMKEVNAGYKGSRILFGISFAVCPGEAVALMGRNGMGKTTALNALFGLVSVTGGHIYVKGRDLSRMPPHRIAASGLGYVPEGRQIFPRLTVEENLIAISANNKNGRWNLGEVYRLFPMLYDRRRHLGTQLSGGEQQMLAIGRALMINPDLLVLDEATEGLAPLVRKEIWKALSSLKMEGLAVLIVDKDLNALMALADRHIVLEKGEVAWAGGATELAANRPHIESYLGI